MYIKNYVRLTASKKERSYFHFLIHVFRSKNSVIEFKDTTPCCPTKTDECNALNCPIKFITAAFN